MWIQLDFDVIDVTFSNGTEQMAIPVIASPIDIAHDGKPPESWQDESSMTWWEIALAVLALILLTIVLAPLLPYVFKFLVWLLILPAKLVGWIISFFRKKNK